MSAPLLHSYWRSSAAYRVRIALNLKGIAYDQATHNLLKSEQRDPAYLAIAPHGLVPSLEADGLTLIESPAILEWIDARWPSPALIPQDPAAAAIVRAMGALIACDIHPIANLRVLNALRSELGASEDQVQQWGRRWIGEGFAALEAMIARHGGIFAFGDIPGLVDCYLVPQLYNARRVGLDLAPFPRLVAAGDAAAALSAVAAAHPDRQPDAEP